jgi:Tfp pilus assembly protein PilE
MIIGFIFGGIIIGILLLIAYLKYDELIRRTGPSPPPPPPPP